MKRMIFLRGISAVLILGLGFLGMSVALQAAEADTEASTPASAKVSAGISVVDYAGRKVALKAPAARIVALAPHIVENLFAAGAGSRVVGVVDYCDYPEQAKKIPKVGAISTHSLEAIIALKPDLVVVWGSLGGAKILPKLEALGLTAYVSDPHTLPDVARSIRDYGLLAGTLAQAEQAASAYEQQLRTLTVDYQQKKSVSVLYQVWYQPLQTLNDKHIISDVIRLCGGRNAFGDAPTLAPKISIESVIARNPDAIIASGMGEARPDWLDNWLAWSSLTAVKNKHLFFVPPDLIQRHTPRILQGAQLMCDQLEQVRLE
ncbi:cobalamin-binding protein [Marinagarivorans algicola]|uniref:cobalamin-binding protein n=1 Tax=Marinagarivorans algicola TaxID=1513270 RepID=UPI0006B91726|nr:cobalamin-binding protein [Marinagarivorans algicola]